ncbi:MAG: FadR family transcriptional regulator [Anaerolineae bacterium]|nr:FadR family transcriptional regulator [Anaerolineae bacterium]
MNTYPPHSTFPIDLDSELLEYMVERGFQPGDRLPSLSELQSVEHLGVSISKVREQLEVARALGLVEVRSKTGMRMKEYSFTPAVRLSLFFALAQDSHQFEQFSKLRNHVEAAFWHEACAHLQPEDLDALCDIVRAAQAKLNGHHHAGHIQIPNREHRAFHLTIFSRLENPFVMGILEAYWDAYEAVELHHFADYDYLQRVWGYHGRILDAITAGDFERARILFVEHTLLIQNQPRMQSLSRPSEPEE